jgi:hypothetical protein
MFKIGDRVQLFQAKGIDSKYDHYVENVGKIGTIKSLSASDGDSDDWAGVQLDDYYQEISPLLTNIRLVSAKKWWQIWKRG